MAVQIGQALQLVADQGQMVSSPPAVRSQVVAMMDMDLTLEQAITLRDLAGQLSACGEPAASSDQIAKHLEYLASALPAKSTDDETGKRKFAVYVRMLSGYSDEALAFMSVEVLRSCDWFPTPRQCLDALARYVQPLSLKEKAFALASRVIQTRFEEWRFELQEVVVDQARIDAAPDRWKRIAFEQGFLRFVDGGYVQRLPKPVEAV